MSADRLLLVCWLRWRLAGFVGCWRVHTGLCPLSVCSRVALLRPSSLPALTILLSEQTGERAHGCSGGRRRLGGGGSERQREREEKGETNSRRQKANSNGGGKLDKE